MMKKEKKHKYVASDWYEFDEEKEKNIYLYVCGKKTKKRVEKNMDENVKFNTEYFLMDYKVIIDNMIKERQKYL